IGREAGVCARLRLVPTRRAGYLRGCPGAGEVAGIGGEAADLARGRLVAADRTRRLRARCGAGDVEARVGEDAGARAGVRLVAARLAQPLRDRAGLCVLAGQRLEAAAL